MKRSKRNHDVMPGSVLGAFGIGIGFGSISRDMLLHATTAQTRINVMFCRSFEVPPLSLETM